MNIARFTILSLVTLAGLTLFSISALSGPGCCPRMVNRPNPMSEERAASVERTDAPGCVQQRRACASDERAERPLTCPVISGASCCAEMGVSCCVSGSAPACAEKPALPQSSDGEVVTEGKITPSALQALLRAGVPVTLVDARGDGLRQSIPGSLRLACRSGEEAVSRSLPNKDALLLVYASNPSCLPSRLLAGRLREMGYTNVLELEEGIQGWIKAGGAVEILATP